MPYVTLAPNDNTPPLSVHYQTWGERPAPAPTLVLVHELGGTLESLRGFASLLQADCRVIGFDQRGVGLTEKPSAAFTMLDLADDIGRLADALAIPRPFHLLGLAMGAATALQFAARHSDQLASLVLCDGTPEIVESAKRYIVDRAAVVRKQGMRTVLDQSFNNAFRGLPDPDGNPEWVAYRHKFLSTPPDSYATHSEALAAMHMEPADFARVRCRTLLLTGQHDFIWPPEVGQDLASRLPNASFEVVANAAHFPPIQAPHHVAGRVLQFINSSH
jgi:3-oxoadipate enol-lactonase